jgi:hypothetical protein
MSIASLCRPVRPHVIPFLAGCAIAGTLLIAALAVLAERSPVKIDSIYAVDDAAVRGGVLYLHAQIDRRKWCPTDVQRWMWRWADPSRGVQQWVWISDAPSPPTPIGRDDYVVAIPLPAAVTSGQWFYVGIAHDRCPFLDWPLRNQRETKNVPVSVIDPTTSAPATVAAPQAPFGALPSAKEKP